MERLDGPRDNRTGKDPQAAKKAPLTGKKRRRDAVEEGGEEEDEDENDRPHKKARKSKSREKKKPKSREKRQRNAMGLFEKPAVEPTADGDELQEVDGDEPIDAAL